MKYPECAICKFLKDLDVDEDVINDYHESKITMNNLPQNVQVELMKFFEELDSNAHLVLSVSHSSESEEVTVERTLTIKMKGKLKDINSYCSAVGELSNTYGVECDFS